MNPAKAAAEIREERRSVGFDSYDITAKQLVDMVGERQIQIAPDYQRRFIWDDVRQSQLIESLLLGIPIPSLFLATNEDSTWEVIDGLQRLTSLLNFINPSLRPRAPHEQVFAPLVLNGLDKVKSLNGATFSDFPANMQLNFLTRPVRITVLNDRSDHQVRFDLFERLNTGGITLHEQEIRNCVYQGPFNDFVKSCAADPRIGQIIKRTDRHGRGNTEELILKFFAYYETRDNFRHSVKDFLNEYMESKTLSFTNKRQLSEIFNGSFQILADHLPNGIVRTGRPSSTPLILFEAISIGVADILSAGRAVDPTKLVAVLDDDELKRLTTGATNSLPKLKGRIDYVSEHVAA